MDEADIARALDDVDGQLDRGHDPDMSRFWKAVGEVKRHPGLADRFADRIGRLDRRAFERWRPMIVMPQRVGTPIAVATTAAGLGLIAGGYYLGEPWNGLAMLAGTGVLLASTHGLGHLAAGAVQGIRFSHWFVAGLTRPQPGVKIDYATYLRASPRGRAWMHASGAIVTKVVPFVALGAAIAAGTPTWTRWTLVGLGVLQLVTDAVWSVRASDWKRFRRELRHG